MTKHRFAVRLLVTGMLLMAAPACQTAAQVMNHYPQWSPDGRWILFGSNRTGSDEMYLVAPADLELRRLTDDDAFDVNVGWSPEGRVLFQTRVDDTWVRYSIAVDGTDRRRAPDPDSVLATGPSGEWIAFSTGRDGARTVYVARADGSRARRVSSAGHVEQPAFSPDGGWIVFEERADHMAPMSSSLLVVDRVEGGSRRVVSDGGTDPSWSPDGTRILHKVSERGSGRYRIAHVDVSGGRPPVLLDYGVLPEWSPDGAWIAYMTEEEPVTHIWVVRPDGSDGRCLTCG